MKEHKKVIILTIIFIVLASVVWVMHLYGKGLKTPSVSKEIGTDFTVKELPVSELPSALPKNLPFESDAPILRNEIIDVSQGREIQHLRTYISKKTVAENVKSYRDFFTKEGWKIAAESIDKDLATIIATKEGNVIKLTVSKNSITFDVNVEVVVTLRTAQ
jgi:hypothetical protein